jgi:predicted RNA methylase
MEKLGNRRKTGVEQYYTPKDLALELSSHLVVQTGIDHAFLEPAGGNGAFIDALNQLGVQQIEAVDLYPKHPAVAEADFLTYEPKGRNLVTVSNPPFGRNNSLSIPFFNHAAKESDYIAFLVPRSWRKWSVQNRLDRRFHLISDQDVAVNYVTDTGEQIGTNNDLRTCFQIWEKRAELRSKVKVKDQGLIRKCSPAEADLAVRVFGFGCGKVYRDFPRVGNTTLMFLTVSDARVFEVIEGLDYERFTLNTSYTRALALPELNYLLNEAIFGDPMIRLEA